MTNREPDLTPAHVGEEDQEEGDSEQGLVQDSLQGDHPDSVSHGIPCVKPAVPGYKIHDTVISSDITRANIAAWLISDRSH